jgi:hypothetical protein
MRRREWFEAIETLVALWWAPVRHVPTPDEGWTRLRTLERLGPTAEAFTVRHPFPAPDALAPETPILDRFA